jgi:protein TonB
MNVVIRHLAAVVAMVLGTASVFALLYAMNELGRTPEREAPAQAAEFNVDKPPEKKRTERPRPQRAQQRTPAPARHAPPPNIATTLSGMNFGLPQFQSDQIVGTDQLLGTSAASSKLVMTADTVDTPPRRRSCSSPSYPDKARQRGIQGYVLLKLKLSERGDVEQVTVVEAEPRGVFEDAALTALRQCTFEPATYKGQAVAMADVMQRIPFRLN